MRPRGGGSERRSAAVLALLLSLLAAPRVHADQVRYRPYIVNGLMSTQYPTTGALLFGNSAGTAGPYCSGTLIGCETFLTAAHCVCDAVGTDCQGAGAPDPANYFVYLQHAGIFSVSSIALRPDFDFPTGDVAVLKLAVPVTGIAPTHINTTASPSPSTAALIAGFGRTGGTNYDYGVKRFGSVTMATCAAGISNTTSLCWKFDDPFGQPGSNSNTCNGDSGGPLFIDFGAGPVVAGVTSGGSSADCLPTDSSFDANVYFYRAWIQSQAGADLTNSACGAIPQVGTRGASVFAASGTLGAGESATHSFPVPPGATLLRVTLNAVTDFDLYVKAGSPPTISDYDCQQSGTNGYGACEFNGPATGTWYALVQQYSGSGAYQFTATKFGLDCSDPGNSGLPCDDSNQCTTDDRCQNGVCNGTPMSNGTPCDDGDACTNPDTCTAGICGGGHQPRAGCITPFNPVAGSAHLREPVARPATLSWRWLKGHATDLASFGNPVNATSYSLCAYDQTAGRDVIVINKRIAAGGACGTRACWHQTTRGFLYSDRNATTGGISGIDLKDGVDGRAQIIVRGRGAGLALPALPLHQDSTVTIQLGNGTTCWEARYTTNSKNTPTDFRAKPGN